MTIVKQSDEKQRIIRWRWPYEAYLWVAEQVKGTPAREVNLHALYAKLLVEQPWMVTDGEATGSLNGFIHMVDKVLAGRIPAQHDVPLTRADTARRRAQEAEHRREQEAERARAAVAPAQPQLQLVAPNATTEGCYNLGMRIMAMTAELAVHGQHAVLVTLNEMLEEQVARL